MGSYTAPSRSKRKILVRWNEGSSVCIFALIQRSPTLFAITQVYRGLLTVNHLRKASLLPRSVCCMTTGSIQSFVGFTHDQVRQTTFHLYLLDPSGRYHRRHAYAFYCYVPGRLLNLHCSGLPLVVCWKFAMSCCCHYSLLHLPSHSWLYLANSHNFLGCCRVLLSPQ